MSWFPIVAAVVIAVIFTLVLVSLLGWRRPGATQTESIVTSGVFFFMILVLATWAAGSWMAPRGPMALGVPWLVWMGVPLVITLIVAVVTQPWDRHRSRSARPTTPAGTAPAELARANENAAVGFGLAFWALVVVLLLVALAGTYHRL
jgi:predicted signal transduction protein with EAL and GGDEF domain